MTSRGEAALPDDDLDRADAGAHVSELFARHGPTVLGLCRFLLRDRQEAEDAAQQTFLSAYLSLLGGTMPRYPAAWLATIARNECWGRIKRRMREPLPSAEGEDTMPDPVAAAAARADLAELWRAIGELPEKQREALLLREFSGLSYTELAAALSVSEPAVESLLFRARTALRLRLQPVYASVAGVAPLAAIRHALARAIGGMPDPATARGLGRIAATPAVAKVIVGAASIVVAGGTIAVVEPDSTPRQGMPSAAAAASVPAERPVPVVQPPAESQPLRTRQEPTTSARAPLVVSSAVSVPSAGLRPAPSQALPRRATPAEATPTPPGAEFPTVAQGRGASSGTGPVVDPEAGAVPPQVPGDAAVGGPTGDQGGSISSAPGSTPVDQSAPAQGSDGTSSGLDFAALGEAGSGSGGDGASSHEVEHGGGD